MCQPVGMQSGEPFYRALTDWPCTPSTGANTRKKTFLSFSQTHSWIPIKRKSTGNTSYCGHSSAIFHPLVFSLAAVPLKNKFASIYGSAGWIESFRCNGVRGEDECGYLCWRHWDAGQGSIRLCRAKPSMWTICHCSTNPHPHQLHPKLSFWTGSTCFPSRLCSVNPKRHVTQVRATQTPGYIPQQALIASGLSATTSSYFPNSLFTPTLWFNTSSAGCTCLRAAGGGK